MGQEKQLEDYYVIRNHKKLRFGYTTGSCAAAAAKGAVQMLLSGTDVLQTQLLTPKGILLRLALVDRVRDEHSVSCAVRKDAGDDPDTTDGILIYARAQIVSEKAGMSKNMDSQTIQETVTCPEIADTAFVSGNIILDAGDGIGRVTKSGLSQQIGQAAINRVPREMIFREVQSVAEQYGYQGRILITVYAPEGRERAKRTFNPRLGIVGGISILGTTGIVEPMSERALIDSIRVEMGQHHACGEDYLLVTPGNYGAEYLREHMTLPFEKSLKCSNYFGETIDMAVDMGVKGILFVAHIGKLVKLAAGIMNTHSHSADARMEILASNAIRAGGTLDCARELLACTMTDEALRILDQYGILEGTMQKVMQKIQFYLNHRSYDQILLGAVMFSNEYGFLGETEDAEKLRVLLGEKHPAKEQERL